MIGIPNAEQERLRAETARALGVKPGAKVEILDSVQNPIYESVLNDTLQTEPWENHDCTTVPIPAAIRIVSTGAVIGLTQRMAVYPGNTFTVYL